MIWYSVIFATLLLINAAPARKVTYQDISNSLIDKIKSDTENAANTPKTVPKLNGQTKLVTESSKTPASEKPSGITIGTSSHTTSIQGLSETTTTTESLETTRTETTKTKESSEVTTSERPIETTATKPIEITTSVLSNTLTTKAPNLSTTKTSKSTTTTETVTSTPNAKETKAKTLTAEATMSSPSIATSTKSSDTAPSQSSEIKAETTITQSTEQITENLSTETTTQPTGQSTTIITTPKTTTFESNIETSPLSTTKPTTAFVELPKTTANPLKQCRAKAVNYYVNDLKECRNKQNNGVSDNPSDGLPSCLEKLIDCCLGVTVQICGSADCSEQTLITLTTLCDNSYDLTDDCEYACTNP